MNKLVYRFYARWESRLHKSNNNKQRIICNYMQKEKAEANC